MCVWERVHKIHQELMSAEQTRTIVGALRATESEKRSVTSLDGIWNFCVDAEDNGEQNRLQEHPRVAKRQETADRSACLVE